MTTPIEPASDTVKNFLESFHITVAKDSFYQDVTLHLDAPHSLSIRLRNDSTKSWIFADLEERRRAALAQTAPAEVVGEPVGWFVKFTRRDGRVRWHSANDEADARHSAKCYPGEAVALYDHPAPTQAEAKEAGIREAIEIARTFEDWGTYDGACETASNQITERLRALLTEGEAR